LAYRFSDDRTTVGSFRFSPAQWKLLAKGTELLRSRLSDWNQRVAAAGGEPPYAAEVAYLSNILRHGQEQVVAGEIYQRGLSITSVRFYKAALRLLRDELEEEIGRNRASGWPSAALDRLRASLFPIDSIREQFDVLEADVLWELIPRPIEVGAASGEEWDVFLSHASEDKEDFVRPLAGALAAHGLRVWYDEFTLRIGSRLRRSIDKGLASSRYGVVVISPSFLAKEWPQLELDGLVALESDGRDLILPVWFNITKAQLVRVSPLLADRVAAKGSDGFEKVAEQLVAVIRSS